MQEQNVIKRQVGTAEPFDEPVVLPPSAPAANEGKTVAGWTLTYVAMFGALVIAVGMAVEVMVAIWVGIGITVLGLVLGAVLRMMGHGQPRAVAGRPVEESAEHGA